MAEIVPARFSGRTVVVTGAGSGIGRATALRVAREQGRVIATDIVPDRLDDLTAQLARDVPDALTHTVAGDISEPEVIARIVSAAGERIDALANVAGIMDGFLPPAEIDDATWDRVFAVNVTGPMRLTRAILPVMLAAGVGSIVNVASEASLRASASGAAYTASKHAIAGYTKSVAFFYGPQGVRANAVAPGPVITNIEAAMKSAHAGQRVGPILRATIPAPAEPERLAAAISWLLSDDSLNVNGALLPSDGGWSTV